LLLLLLRLALVALAAPLLRLQPLLPRLLQHPLLLAIRPAKRHLLLLLLLLLLLMIGLHPAAAQTCRSVGG
jgi:hypothetical protein